MLLFFGIFNQAIRAHFKEEGGITLGDIEQMSGEETDFSLSLHS